MPIANLQYLCLVAIPASFVVPAIVISVLRMNWFLKQMHARFDSIDSMLASFDRPPYRSLFHK